MENQHFDELVVELIKNSSWKKNISVVNEYLQTIDNANFAQFVTAHFHALARLEEWIWFELSSTSPPWINSSEYLQIFQTLGQLHRQMIFMRDQITVDQKATLLIPKHIDPINSIFEYIEKNTNDNIHHSSYFQIICLWLDNISDCVYEYPELLTLPVIAEINQMIAKKFIMTTQYRQYLCQLKEAWQNISFKQYFYLRTCSVSLGGYFFSKMQSLDFTGNEILQYLRGDYLQIITFHTEHIESWSKDLLSCLTGIIFFICACCWWSGVKTERVKILLPTESITQNYIQSLTRILNYRIFHELIQKQRLNDETRLIDAVLGMVLSLIETLNLAFYIRSETNLIDILVPLSENALFNRINLCAYGILGEILSDEQLKDLKITNNICSYFFYMLEEAWLHSTRKAQRVSISILLRGFLGLCKNDSIQEKVGQNDKMFLFVDMWDDYPLVMEILWALSFNKTVQEKLRSNRKLMNKLSNTDKKVVNEQMEKIIHGILWNLENNHDERKTSDDGHDHDGLFDIMISYSHKDQFICRQIYDELVRHGYRVWIDFDQMHGNVMDAMARAIERSHTILVCMSEQYRRSSYCRAEAHYAFQRQLRIVPVLVQRNYKPDGWLLFLVGQLLYVDFIKYDLNIAARILIKELESTFEKEEAKIPRSSIEPELSSVSQSHVPIQNLPENISDWTTNDVHQWLIGHRLVQMSQLLSDYDGCTLIYFNRYLVNSESSQMLSLLQEDALRRTGQSLSIVELARFRKLLDDKQQRRSFRSGESTDPMDRSNCQIL